MNTRAVLCGLLATSLCAQQTFEPGEMRASSSPYRLRRQFTLRVETKLVEVGVVVRDSRGRAVAGLTKDDFEITDDGKRRPVVSFTVETSSPASAPAPATTPAPAEKVSQRYVGLMFDDLSMGPGELPQARIAARRFVRDGLKPGDHVAIFTTSASQNLPFTSDSAKLVAAIDKLHLNNRPPDGGTCPHMTPYDAYSIANRLDISAFNVKIAETASCQGYATPAEVTSFEGGSAGGRGRGRQPPPPPPQILQQVKAQASSIWEQVRMMSQSTLASVSNVVKYMAAVQGDRTLVLASAGFLSGTLEYEMDEITRQALHAGVVINALDAKGLYVEDPPTSTGGSTVRSLIRQSMLGTTVKEAGNDALASLAYNTGGLFFHNNNDLDAGFRELGMRPEVSYLLGFAPPESPDGRYHKLRVRITAPGNHSVQARRGYMATAPEAPPSEPERRIDTAAIAAGATTEIAGSFAAEAGRDESGEPYVRATFHVDVKNLRFETVGGAHHQKLSLIALLLDPAGNFVTAKEGAVELALKDETFSRLSQDGWNLTLSLPAAAGSYRVRGVLGEGLDNKISAWTTSVEIPR